MNGKRNTRSEHVSVTQCKHGAACDASMFAMVWCAMRACCTSYMHVMQLAVRSTHILNPLCLHNLPTSHVQYAYLYVMWNIPQMVSDSQQEGIRAESTSVSLSIRYQIHRCTQYTWSCKSWPYLILPSSQNLPRGSYFRVQSGNSMLLNESGTEGYAPIYIHESMSILPG